MADAITRVSDMASIPELFGQYLTAEIYAKSALVRSGAAFVDPRVAKVVNSVDGGSMITLPEFNPLSGDSTIIGDSNGVDSVKVSSHKKEAIAIMRKYAVSEADLATYLATGDKSKLLDVVVNGLADYWVKEKQKIALAVLKGIFASTDGADFSFDANGAGDVDASTGDKIDVNSIIDTMALRGDAEDNTKIMIVHPVIEAQLRKLNLIETTSFEGTDTVLVSNQRGALSGPNITKMVLGMQLIVDQTMPVEDAASGGGKVYTSYILGENSIVMADGFPFVPFESDRDISTGAGETKHVSRISMVVQPVGWSYAKDGGTAQADISPTNTELSTGAKWSVPGEDNRECKVYQLRTNG